mmetsp:Transcript_20674/g.49691  ORF Transcript_20674/g.49691 Transcript_20674/m.49691 type:complete len:80 (-) Transcript_20674:325-564(-)
MRSWPPPTKRCKRKRRLVGAENRWVSTSSANPSSPFCELVAIWTKGGEWEKLILLTKLKALPATTCHGACRQNQHRMRC